MIEILINDIEQAMLNTLTNEQLCQMRKVLDYTFHNVCVTEVKTENTEESNSVLVSSFLSSKSVDGCSEKTISCYRSTLNNALRKVGKKISHVTTDDLHTYLNVNDYQNESNASKVTVDNIRRILSSFLAWLEDENYIVKSPVRRIHKVKTGITVKETYSDEALDEMRDHAGNSRDLALIDLLTSTRMRVGELVKLNRNDIDFQNRECIVSGNEDKQRKVYFDARTKFRRTLATMAIDKGMPIEQVQHLLGHQSLDTTLQYAMVNQNNAKSSHRKHLG